MLRVIETGDMWDENCIALALYKTQKLYHDDPHTDAILYTLQKILLTMKTATSVEADEAMRWWRNNKEDIEEEMLEKEFAKEREERKKNARY